MIYKIIQNGRIVTPPANVSRIYHGPHLIWERAQKTGQIIIEKVFEAEELAFMVFTKKGKIVPEYISKNVPEVGFDLQGNRFNINVPELKTGTDMFNKPYKEECVFLWSDVPAYKIKAVDARNGYGDVKLNIPIRDYIEQQPSGEFVRITPAPVITDTADQWLQLEEFSDSVESTLKKYPTTISTSGGHGMYPMNRPLGFFQNETQISNLSYIKDGKILSNSEFVILAVCGNELVCGENITYDDRKTRAVGDITIRDLNFNLKHTMQLGVEIGLDYMGNSMEYTPPKDFHYTGGKLFWREYNMNLGKHELFCSTRIGAFPQYAMPYGVAYADNYFYILDDNKKNILWYADTDTIGGNLKQKSLVDSVTGENYTMNNAWCTNGGAYYVDNAGALYLIVETPRQNMYAVIRITRG